MDALPHGTRNRTLAGSVADTQWTARVLRRVPGLKSQLPAFPVFQARLGLDPA
jgi:hypothetical protein